MPIYKLECIECGTTEEVKALYREVHLIKCGSCQGNTRVVPAPTGFQIKGYSEANGYSKGGGAE